MPEQVKPERMSVLDYLKEMVPAGAAGLAIPAAATTLGPIAAVGAIPAGVLAAIYVRKLLAGHEDIMGPVGEDIKALPRTGIYGLGAAAGLGLPSVALLGPAGLPVGAGLTGLAAILGHYRSLQRQRAGEGWF